MLAACAVVAYVVVARLVELFISNRNTRVLRARGAVEYGAAHYPVIVAIHAAWFIALIAFLPRPFVMHWVWLGVFAILQALRIWTMASLGAWFSTKVLTVPGVSLVARGPYRFMRHPNYAIVAGEIASLPLAFGEAAVAIVFSVLNIAVLAFRIRTEDTALAPRRALPPG
jgi:methyltransferase